MNEGDPRETTRNRSTQFWGGRRVEERKCRETRVDYKKWCDTTLQTKEQTEGMNGISVPYLE